jgi:catechol 2,3-dioxygenase-like lactoylglutathione lyase family enzyme
VDVLSSRLLMRPSAFEDAVAWYRDVLGLHVYREYGAAGRVTGVVFFLGGGFLELVGDASSVAPGGGALWLQVADVDAEHERLREQGADIQRPPKTEPWGLRECWIADPDGIQIRLIEVPDDHPLRRRVGD